MRKKLSVEASAADGNVNRPRRSFLKGGVGLAAGVAAGQLLGGQVGVQAQQNAGMAQTLRAANASGRAILIKDGVILSLDRQVGDFDKADVLIQGKKISSVGPNLAASAPKDAVVVNAAKMIVMPGFVDTHHHQYETVMRNILADGLLGQDGAPKKNYGTVMGGVYTPVYIPADARIGELVSSLSQINAGVTTTIDTSQVQLTPEHTDACIAGLKESGRRAVFSYGANGKDAATRFPVEMDRLKKQYFSSNDQLLTLGVNGGPTEINCKVARAHGALIISHIQQVAAIKSLVDAGNAGLMGPDNVYVHCTRISQDSWKKIADSGGHVSIAVAIEMQMRHGMPPFQNALDHGIRPALSVDVECNMTADFLQSCGRHSFCSVRWLTNAGSTRNKISLPCSPAGMRSNWGP